MDNKIFFSLCDFAFAVDIISYMNELNVKLQRKDHFLHDMYTNVRAFKSKIILFPSQMANKCFANFPILSMQKEATQNKEKYGKSLDDLQRESIFSLKPCFQTSAG